MGRDAAAGRRPRGTGGGPPARFQGADVGDDQVARGFRSGGTPGGWREAVGPALAAPKLRLAVTFSLAPPLLAVLNAPNPFHELCGETSGGKTVALRVAASVWGCPDERSPHAVMGTWDTTRVGAERTLAVVNNLPLFLDDTRRAKDADLVSALVYDVASGRGRKRGTPKGVQRSSKWSTALLSSGESSVNDLAEEGGAKARVVSVWGSPFGEVSGPMGERVKALNRAVLAHFGHAGPAFVQHLLDRRDAWPGWVVRYEQLTRYYASRAGDNPVLGRLADTFAMLEVVGELAAVASELPALAKPPVEELWAELVGGRGRRRARPGVALRPRLGAVPPEPVLRHLARRQPRPPRTDRRVGRQVGLRQRGVDRHRVLTQPTRRGPPCRAVRTPGRRPLLEGAGVAAAGTGRGPPLSTNRYQPQSPGDDFAGRLGGARQGQTLRVQSPVGFARPVYPVSGSCHHPVTPGPGRDGV